MGTISVELRRRAVEAYRSGLTKSYEATAEMFGIGRASFDRLLRRFRETGDVLPKPRGGNNPILVDDAWLLEHAKTNPDARLSDRVAAWAERSGRVVTIATMSNAMRRIGWTHQKRLWSRESATSRRSRRGAKPSSARSPSSTPHG